MLAATYKIDIIYDPQPPHPHAMIYAHTAIALCTSWMYVLLLVWKKSVYNFWEMCSTVVWDIV